MDDVVGSPVLGPHGKHDGGAEIHRDARVDGQLAGRGDVGVVAADDQHRVARLDLRLHPHHGVRPGPLLPQVLVVKRQVADLDEPEGQPVAGKTLNHPRILAVDGALAQGSDENGDSLGHLILHGI